MGTILDFILHLDTHLQGLIQHYGAWSYLILFGVLFAETGFVFTPFLPGDSLIFVSGALAAKGIALSLPLIYVVFALGAIVGDSVNFEIGKRLGPRLFKGEKVRFFNPKSLKRTEEFFQKHGNKTIILARFIPVVRTFAPFVAGTGKMPYKQFLAYNVVGGLLWVALFLFGGYLFGNVPFIKDHFMIVVGVIVVLSLVPAVYEIWRSRQETAGDDAVKGGPPAAQPQRAAP